MPRSIKLTSRSKQPNYRPKVGQKTFAPKIGKHVFVDPSAQVIGRVTLGDQSSIWAGCVLRGDINRIVVGKRTNVQDLSVLHVESNRACILADDVTIGHQVTLHACTVKRYALIGIQSIILDGAVIGEGCLVGAGSLVTHGQKLKPWSLYLGRPAKFSRSLKPAEKTMLKNWSHRYLKYAQAHLEGRYERLKAED